MKDGDGKRTFKLGPIVTMGFKRQKQNPPNPPNKTHLFNVCLASKPRGTQWVEDLSCEPSQHNEPPIPGPSSSAEPPEDILTREPEPEVAPTQATEDPFAHPTTPRSVIIIDNMPIGSPTPPPSPPVTPPFSPTPVPSSPHSHDDACQEFTNFDDCSSHRPQINQPNLVGESLLAPHDSFHGCNSLK
ncbi:hypothetical protein O181_053504 [Austropuccinia psidii MF-1]|uniref:Uncharacterized protein n=1 Tax=Austropuccinia psidii MF-1 TaxID=1389203 RepID=A0A9Q3HSQ4_9BASI|nr:hypothetical protein [Austropuccinia psidii MF-1]